MTAPSEVLEPFAERVERLYDELELAIEWNRPAILLAIYRSRFVMLDAQLALATRLVELGQRIEHVLVDTDDKVDVPKYLANFQDRNTTVFFIEGLGVGGQVALRALNIRREYLVDERIRTVFWLTEPEARALADEAPDFWAFRHRVVEFLDRVQPRAANRIGQELVKGRLDERPIAEDATAKIALREGLLRDLPETKSTLPTRIDLHIDLGRLYRGEGHLNLAERQLLAALEAVTGLADLERMARTLDELGALAQYAGNYHEAQGRFEESLTIKVRLDDQRGAAATMYQLGNLAQEQGTYAEARRLYEEALDSFQRLGDQRGVAATQHQLGNLALEQGEVAEARRLYEESLAIERRLGDQRSAAATLHRLGMLAQERGEAIEARRLYEEAVDSFQRLGDQRGIAATLHRLGNLAYERGEMTEARRLYEESLTIERRLGDQRGIALALYRLGSLAQTQNAH
ncbi:MAG TPA: tetratricopeptide repeat protein, partial [Herpetosiphonaceae bacterium]|nr:tetratricopeptide repeat protein [Herpetosiphonaceae bacterium]